MLKNFNLNLINKNEHLLLAVSGGIDSMVMFHYLVSKAKELNLKLSVAYMDHQKRSDSYLDYKLITETCKNLHINCYTEKLEPNDNENFHDYAHLKRYDFFADTAEKIKANKIVLAHNANDNAETILMRLTRGSSFEGYRGILPESSYRDVKIIRPMLKVGRNDIVAYQTVNLVEFNEDSSNEKDDYTRNRYRHHIMNILEQENPRYLDKFTQFSDYQNKAFMLISKLSDQFIKDSLKKSNKTYNIDISDFNELDEIIKIESIKKIVNKLTNNSVELSYTNIMDIIRLFDNEKPHVELLLSENLYIHKSYNLIHFSNKKSDTEEFSFTVNDIQKVNLPDGSIVIITKNPNKYYGFMYKLCYNNLDLTFPLTIRNRMDGDRINTTSGTKKLKDLFIDKKIPLKTRNNIPIITNKNQEILWVPNIFKEKTTGENTIYIIYQEGK